MASSLPPYKWDPDRGAILFCGRESLPVSRRIQYTSVVSYTLRLRPVYGPLRQSLDTSCIRSGNTFHSCSILLQYTLRADRHGIRDHGRVQELLNRYLHNTIDIHILPSFPRRYTLVQRAISKYYNYGSALRSFPFWFRRKQYTHICAYPCADT